LFHGVEAVSDPGGWHPVHRDALLHYADGGRWQLRDGRDLIETYGFDEARISLSWKAEVYLG